MKVVGFTNKQDLIRLYSTHYRAFSDMIEPIKSQIGWRDGKQQFSTRQVQLIIEYLGPPVLDIG